MGLSIDYKTKREFTIFHNFFKESRFHLLLSSIDEEIGLSTRLVGCNYCGGILHRADYPRSPIWISTELRVYYDERISFCCNNNKCRKRTTPPSVRFFGRIWVPGPLFIIISLLTDGISLRRIESIKRRFGIDIKLSTWMRWREWWLSKFPQTKFWQQNMGIVSINLKPDYPFPKTFLILYCGAIEAKILALIKFLLPMTGGVLRAI